MDPRNHLRPHLAKLEIMPTSNPRATESSCLRAFSWLKYACNLDNQDSFLKDRANMSVKLDGREHASAPNEQHLPITDLCIVVLIANPYRMRIQPEARR